MIERQKKAKTKVKVSVLRKLPKGQIANDKKNKHIGE